MTPRDELGQFLADYVADFEGTVTLTASQHGWILEPRGDDASPVWIWGDDVDLWDLTVCFGRSAGRIELRFSERVTPAEALATAKDVVRAVANGGLVERRRGIDSSKWTLQSGDQRWRGSSNWLPAIRRRAAEQFAPWPGSA